MALFKLKEKVALKIVKNFPTWLHPMHLTILRLVLVLPLVILLLDGKRLETVILFIFMALLDYFDGPLARLRNQVSISGKLLDPFADKLMVLPIFYILSLPILPYWLILSTIGLEVLLVLLAFLLKPFFEKIGQKRSLGANKFGKYKMTLQTIGVLWLLLVPAVEPYNTLVVWLFYIALILSALSITKHLMPQR